MKSVALLPAHGDPFCLKHLLLNYDRVWRGEVDELYVLVSGQPDPEVCAYMRRETERVGAVYLGDSAGTMDHGVSLRVLAEHCGLERNGVGADVLFLIESDARVRRRGAVAERVARIASGEDEVIGSPRISMDGRLAEALDRTWGKTGLLTPDGCEGYGLWPCFVFARTDVLLFETDRNYSARGWLAGEEVAGPNIRCEEDGWCADTFGSAALQLRGRHRITPDVQYKGPWMWRHWFAAGHDIPWFHVGSLSSWGGSAGGLVVDGDSVLADGRLLDTDEERFEWGHRVHWWLRFLEHAGDDLPRQQRNYRRNLDRLVDVMGIESRHYLYWTPIIDRLCSWGES